MPRARITNIRTERRRLLAVWFGSWLDTALEQNFQEARALPGWSSDETRQLLLTLKDLRDDCENENRADIVEAGGYNDVPYGRKPY
jgi:hypothetical protein